MTDTHFEFTDLDRKIIELLKTDGRMSNQKIAELLNVKPSLVSTRIRRMETANAMRVVAVSDFSAFQHNVLLPIGIDVKGRRANDVAHDLAQLSEVASVQLVSGKHDIEILVTLSNMQKMSDLLLNKLSQIAGVRSLDPSFAVDIIKYDFDVAPI